MTIRKLATLRTVDALRSYAQDVGADLPVADVVDTNGPLASPVEIRDASAGTLTASNRFVALPMEGWDAEPDGRPSDLVRRRWERIGAGGSGLVWGEATAVRDDGRANPRQLVLTADTAHDFAALRQLVPPGRVVGLQLTHSGRYSRPEAGPRPRIAYRHPLLDERVGADDSSLFSDEELDGLVELYVSAAVLARDAGFDFVDVKHCHGYLLHELLSAYDRPGRYGGDLGGRTRFLRAVVERIRDRVPELAVAVRASVFDFVPFVASSTGVGEPQTRGPYRYAFGGDGTGLGIDLSEVHALLEIVSSLGVGLVCTTAGSPYTNPHIQRPAYFPPSDGYLPPEDPLVGVARQIAVTREIAQCHPDLVVVGSGYTYLQEWLPNVAEAVVADGGAAMIGLGRMMLANPTFPEDVLSGRGVERRSLCRTFSDCTTAPRSGMISGCYPLDPFYKERPERERLMGLKDGRLS